MPAKASNEPMKDEPLDLAPDAWERFEAAVDKVVKAPPAHSPEKRRIEDERSVPQRSSDRAVR